MGSWNGTAHLVTGRGTVRHRQTLPQKGGLLGREPVVRTGDSDRSARLRVLAGARWLWLGWVRVIAWKVQRWRNSTGAIRRSDVPGLPPFR